MEEIKLSASKKKVKTFLSQKRHTFISLVLIFVIPSIGKQVAFRIPFHTVHSSTTWNLVNRPSSLDISLWQIMAKLLRRSKENHYAEETITGSRVHTMSINKSSLAEAM